MSASSKIKYIEIYNSHLYKSYGYEIRNFNDLIFFFEYSRADLKRKDIQETDSDIIDDMILYLHYRLHTEGIMQYKEPTEKKIKELNTLLNTYKEDHEYYGTNISGAIHINILKPIQPQEVIDKLNERIQFYQLILELLERNRLTYNL